MIKNHGYFEQFVNSRAYTRSRADSALVEVLRDALKEAIAGAQVRWGGSVAKGTAVVGSDLDVCVETKLPVTEAQRRALRNALSTRVPRQVSVRSHAVRIEAGGGVTRMDIAFANAMFGSRRLPDTTAFASPDRARVARALKLWSRSRGLPRLSGWVVEAFVAHIDRGTEGMDSLERFLKVVEWLSRVTPEAVESVLRPVAMPTWRSEWSARLPGQLEAVRNHARALLGRTREIDAWTSPADVERWLCQ